MLLWHVGECMVWIIDIHIGIQAPTRGYQHCDTNQVLMFGGHLKVWELFESIFQLVIINMFTLGYERRYMY